jgi:hypothetical protein
MIFEDNTGITNSEQLEELLKTNAAKFARAFMANLDIEISDLVESQHQFESISTKVVESIGGGEGEGEYVSRVLEVFVNDESRAFINVTGFYESYEGTEYDSSSWIFVEPRKVEVIQYFAIE